MRNKYILVSGNLYMAHDTPNDRRKGNLYPCCCGRWLGTPQELPPGTIKAKPGATVPLFGRDYEANYLPGDPDGDGITMELVLLCRPGDPEGE